MLVNVCRKQMTDIFAQFKPMEPKEPVSFLILLTGNYFISLNDGPVLCPT